MAYKVAVYGLLALIFAGAAILFFESRTPAKEPARAHRIGVIHLGGAYKDAVDGLRAGLEELGWREGRDYEMSEVDAKGDQKAVKDAAKLLKEESEIIYAVSTPVTQSVREAVGDAYPIVFNVVGDPIGAGFAETYSKPGKNLTGCSNLSAELSGKRLEIFKDAFGDRPSLRFVTFYNPDNSFSAISIRYSRDAVQSLGGIKLDEKLVKTPSELEAALQALPDRTYDGIFNTPDATAGNWLTTIASGVLKMPA